MTQQETYNPAKQAFVSNFRDTIGALSRTIQSGSIDTSVSEEKAQQFEDVDMDEIDRKANENIEKVGEYIFLENNKNIDSAEDIGEIIHEIWSRVNNGIADSQKLRTHEVEYGKDHKLPYGENPIPDKPELQPPIYSGHLQEAMDCFYIKLYEKLRQAEEKQLDPDELAAWIEFYIEGTLHPFTDGCGRTAKSVSAFFLKRLGEVLPDYDSRENYYDAMMAGWDEFLDYYKSLYEQK